MKAKAPHFHRYELVASKSNFYGLVEINECTKCHKQKVSTKGYPSMGLKSKSIYWFSSSDHLAIKSVL